ncbi:hypothetical protein J6590_030520 [Homalodisca vitripennis]|nr:hypothetical protein J6590_030520 [Homalodisca vitripennis]
MERSSESLYCRHYATEGLSWRLQFCTDCLLTCLYGRRCSWVSGVSVCCVLVKQKVLDGPDHLDQHVIHLAARFFTELLSCVATFGDETVEKLVPHVTSFMGVLNSSLKENSDLKHHIESLQDDLTSAEHRCLTLDNSFKGKSIKKLKDELSTCKADNTSLQETVDRGVEAEVMRMLAESQEKIDTLTSEITI